MNSAEIMQLSNSFLLLKQGFFILLQISEYWSFVGVIDGQSVKETPSLVFFGSFTRAKISKIIIVPNSIVLTKNGQFLK